MLTRMMGLSNDVREGEAEYEYEYEYEYGTAGAPQQQHAADGASRRRGAATLVRASCLREARRGDMSKSLDWLVLVLEELADLTFIRKPGVCPLHLASVAMADPSKKGQTPGRTNPRKEGLSTCVNSSEGRRSLITLPERLLQ